MIFTTPHCFFSCSTSLPFSLSKKPSFFLSKKPRLSTWVSSRTRSSSLCTASLITSPDSFEVGRLIGSYGFMNVTSYSGFQSGADLEFSSGDLGQLRVQDVGEGSVKIRLYEGRIAQGPFEGTPVIFKVYPGQRAAGIEADMMAANELNAHAFLQSSSKGICKNLLLLLGGFETKTGEQWLAFRDNGKYSAADFAKATSEKVSRARSLQEKPWNPFEQEQAFKRRTYFVIRLFQGAMNGLAYMHNHERLHQSLGPASVILNTIVERDAVYLVPKLRDLAFSVDISFSSLEEGPSTFSEDLWRRASSAGAFTPMERRSFGIADDIYEAGLLFAYLAFVPFCEAGIMDSLSLQRLLESTFKLDVMATREYCLADDRLLEAVKFLDLGDAAGWELLQAMLNPDFRKRPIAEAVANHRFLTANVL
ncbi:hypothetical protein ERO13_A11G303500v2 [Gossypium hirsutum]|uniref:Uncharacterized protein LOC107963608 n=1 Tax=Gossypium hirsutum TaxID=3635 RepID=A0A1U8PYW1_GOSHI|nr:uncharacterized protein LOC107963608 [Gossypium hirsutum]XP_016755544.1 uncharacterized protein LOC107963608 [Gossypium hirsutum]KAG4177394.1 hypothetical protein ERO13_A11G303500v2 [Gossypium hirsutum]KAG4177395.1 hypothetical protein ERO13_A11G303500v2 [Gossypium hirsutum]